MLWACVLHPVTPPSSSSSQDEANSLSELDRPVKCTELSFDNLSAFSCIFSTVLSCVFVKFSGSGKFVGNKILEQPSDHAAKQEQAETSTDKISEPVATRGAQFFAEKFARFNS